MNARSAGNTQQGIDPAGAGVYRVGGVCLVLVGLIYLTNVTLGRMLGVAPADSHEFLRSLAEHASLARIVYGQYALGDLLFVPAALALYLALNPIAKTPMLLATSLMAVFVIVDMVLTEMNALTLVTLSQHAASAVSDPERAAYVAAADYALATVPLATFCSWVLSSLWVLISSVVLIRGPFGRPLAYLGIVVGIAGIIGGFYVLVPALTLLLAPTLLAFGLWLVLMGRPLYKLSAQEPPAQAASARG